MLGPTGFFTFVHSFDLSSGATRQIAFAYKPPGPVLPGAVEELILEVAKGPTVPDAVVLLEILEDSTNGIRDALQSGADELAQARLVGRVPLVHAALALETGKVTTALLDASFKRRSRELLGEVRERVDSWVLSGLRCVFKPEVVVLLAPGGYAYQKPSGSRERFFLKPDLALSTSASVAFVALALFRKLFAGRMQRAEDLRSVYLDTMAIAPVAYGLRDLLDLCRTRQPYLIESFHSYGGMEKIKRPLPGTSVCLISASTSMSLHEKWRLEKEVGPDEVVTLLTVHPIKRQVEGALFAIARPPQVASEGPPQLSIRLMGETFLPEQEPAKKVLLREADHGSPGEVGRFRQFAGSGIFDVFRRPASAGQRARALFVDGLALVVNEQFQSWLSAQLLHRGRAATKIVIHQDDPSSRKLARMVAELCDSKLGLRRLRLVPANELPVLKMATETGVIVCAAVIGKGSQLLEISRALRDKHDGPRLYLVGYQVAEARDELKTLPANLRHSKEVPHEFAAFGAVAIGNQLAQSYQTEVDTYYGRATYLSGLPQHMSKRARALGGIDPIGKCALLPCGERTDGTLEIRPGFAYWQTSVDRPEPYQAEILGTVGVLLQRAREEATVPAERRLSSPSFRHVLLHPENFTRFNDGVLQAALLRNAYPSELDYRGDHAASDFMKSVVVRAIERATEESGEGALEFLLALALRRLQLADNHLAEVIEKAMTVRGPQGLQRAIRFLLRPLTGKGQVRQVIPF